MISLYTETLNDYIAQGGNVHKGLFDLLPTFTVGNQTYNMYDLFITRYGLREIGAETEQLFEHYLMIKLHYVNINYSNKINSYIKAFDNLLSRVVELTRSVTGTDTGSSTDLDYVNPLVTQNGKIQDTTQRNTSVDTVRTETRSQAHSYFKTNPELLEQVLKIENIYYKALDEFEDLFMLVY